MIFLISKKNKARPKKQSRKSGFVILFAVTIASILLAIALGVSNIAYKEVSFGTSGKNANDAFFAADTGAECALFYDKLIGTSFPVGGPATAINCASTSITPSFSLSGSVSSYDFVIPRLGSAELSCAKVNVSKNSASSPPSVVITSSGYNIGDTSCNSTSLNRTERELVVRSVLPIYPTPYPTPSVSFSVEYLIVGGGGGGGAYDSSSSNSAGGGGGGRVAAGSVAVNSGQIYAITVGGGGGGGSSPGQNGQSGGASSVGTLVSTSGGTGGQAAQNSSGGGNGGNSAFSGSAGLDFGVGGGGGGACAPGVTNFPTGWYGGNGCSSSLSGSTAHYGGGGGGGPCTDNCAPGAQGQGSSGLGSLGRGAVIGISGGGSQPPGGGGVNNGGGGGGGVRGAEGILHNGGAGGSGIVIIRYAGAQRATGGTVTSIGGNTIHTFTSSGTFSP